MLKIKGLTKKFSTRNIEVIANRNISFQAKDGEVICILGHNGAGKTTLVKTICGLVTPEEGEIIYKDTSLINNSKFIQENVGAVLEGSRNIYYYMSVLENIVYFGRLNKLDKVDILNRAKEYLEIFQLTTVKNKLVRELSRGMQQKVAIIVALIKMPQILILDEPTLGLDINASKNIMQIIQKISFEEKRIVLITTHDVRLIESLNGRLIFMDKGMLIEDRSLESLKIDYKSNFYEVTFEKDMKRELEGYKITNSSDIDVTYLIDSSISLSTLLEYGEVKFLKPHEVTFEEIYQKVFNKNKNCRDEGVETL